MSSRKRKRLRYLVPFVLFEADKGYEHVVWYWKRYGQNPAFRDNLKSRISLKTSQEAFNDVQEHSREYADKKVLMARYIYVYRSSSKYGNKAIKNFDVFKYIGSDDENDSYLFDRKHAIKVFLFDVEKYRKKVNGVIYHKFDWGII